MGRGSLSTLGWAEAAGFLGMTELMTIGRFSRLSGLSIHALRQYDEVGLLPQQRWISEPGYRR
ncbi:MAG: MerR family regulatory protein [Nocardioidaceae bacterium]|nr:MerR family regulatory protein [Nocardioidaceae bacterium]